MRVATSQQFLEAIIEVLSQFFDYLGLASRLEVQLSQPPSDFFLPINHTSDFRFQIISDFRFSIADNCRAESIAKLLTHFRPSLCD
jgi:hypothetical protein